MDVNAMKLHKTEHLTLVLWLDIPKNLRKKIIKCLIFYAACPIIVVHEVIFLTKRMHPYR